MGIYVAKRKKSWRVLCNIYWLFYYITKANTYKCNSKKDIGSRTHISITGLCQDGIVGSIIHKLKEAAEVLLLHVAHIVEGDQTVVGIAGSWTNQQVLPYIRCFRRRYKHRRTTQKENLPML